MSPRLPNYAGHREPRNLEVLKPQSHCSEYGVGADRRDALTPLMTHLYTIAATILEIIDIFKTLASEHLSSER